ncbi:hypothetical protein BGY98DRAFT_1188510 [Russula aff. rugulosa BPL654]|nr:hypothetical protein BGY98DRAFT_1188510 [Russula aff. rugulosa BPL654]
MRRYDIVTGILLVLSIIDFALAAPVLVQEKHQAHVDAVHIPKDLTTILGKRLDEDLEKLGEEYFKTSGKSIDSSGTHSSSSSAPSGPEPPDHGSTNDVPPTPNLASSTTNPDPSMDPSCSPSSSSQGLRTRGNCFGFLKKMMDVSDDAPASYRSFHPYDSMHMPTFATGYQDYGWSHDWTKPKYMNQMTVTAAHMPQPNPTFKFVSRPPENPPNDDDFDWDLWSKAEDRPSPPSPKRLGQGHDIDDDGASTSGHAPGPPPRDSDSSWPGPPRTEFYSTTVVDSSSLGAESPTEPTEHEVVPQPPPSSDPELHLDDQSSSADSQLEDLPTANYKGKGKAVMESRRISGTARDVGSTTQRELQSAERSLDPGD